MEKIISSIITIGDELLIGQVIDTNSAWMAQELNKNGIWVGHRVAVGDVWDDIWQALDQESQRTSIILITGGLGPTADDITKPLLNKYFNGPPSSSSPADLGPPRTISQNPCCATTLTEKWWSTKKPSKT